MGQAQPRCARAAAKSRSHSPGLRRAWGLASKGAFQSRPCAQLAKRGAWPRTWARQVRMPAWQKPKRRPPMLRKCAPIHAHSRGFGAEGLHAPLAPWLVARRRVRSPRPRDSLERAARNWPAPNGVLVWSDGVGPIGLCVQPRWPCAKCGQHVGKRNVAEAHCARPGASPRRFFGGSGWGGRLERECCQQALPPVQPIGRAQFFGGRDLGLAFGAKGANRMENSGPAVPLGSHF